MSTFRVEGYLVNNMLHPEYDVSADNLIDHFISDDTGAPLQSAAIIIETDDGYTVRISLEPGERRYNLTQYPATMTARVAKTEAKE